MYHTRTWQECWDSSKQSTADRIYPNRLFIRLGHTLAMRLISGNPQGYPVPDRDGKGRKIQAPSFSTETIGSGYSSNRPVNASAVGSMVVGEAVEQSQDLMPQTTSTGDIPKPE